MSRTSFFFFFFLSFSSFSSSAFLCSVVSSLLDEFRSLSFFLSLSPVCSLAVICWCISLDALSSFSFFLPFFFVLLHLVCVWVSSVFSFFHFFLSCAGLDVKYRDTLELLKTEEESLRELRLSHHSTLAENEQLKVSQAQEVAACNPSRQDEGKNERQKEGKKETCKDQKGMNSFPCFYLSFHLGMCSYVYLQIPHV